ncbi:hypothetical protein [Shewanella indica]|uniref:hypothetical protein n=1 Tax=Shewanella indica TaxID=768528 RepID=UPI00399B274E
MKNQGTEDELALALARQKGMVGDEQKELNCLIPEELEQSIAPKLESLTIENLLRNAIRYCHAQVNNCAEAKGSWVEISLTNNGHIQTSNRIQGGSRSSSIYHTPETFRLIFKPGLAA